MNKKTWSGHGITPSLYLRFFGVQRSGNHAVIDGILRNSPEQNYVFLNSCTPERKPFRTLGRLVVNGRLHEQAEIEEKGFRALLAPAAPAPVLAISYENQIFEPNVEVSGNFENSMFYKNIAVIRSFSNWLASILYHGRWIERVMGDAPLDTNIRMLKFVQIYRKFLIHTLEVADDPRLLIVNFDRWHSEENYRRDILAALKFTSRDLSLGAVQRFGQGSSFDNFPNPPNHLR